MSLRIRRRLGALALGVAAAGALLGGVIATQADSLLTDLEAPRGLSTTSGGILVAEQGGGRILLFKDNGNVEVVAENLPVTLFDSPEGEMAAGVTAAIEVNGVIFFLVGEAEPGTPGFQAVYRLEPGSTPVLLADIGAYERANNVDGGVGPDGQPDTNSNPYDLVSDGAGGLLVSDAGANAVFHVSANGTISPYLILSDLPNPLAGVLGGPTFNQVPTGITVGPDGHYYVTTLTGFPFPRGQALVYRFKDQNGDGNALGDGESSIYASGLSAATSLVFAPDGSLLVTEFSTNFLEGEPGRIVRVVDGKVAGVVAAPLISPTGLAVRANGEIVVTQEFLGIVADADTAAAIASQGPPPGDDDDDDDDDDDKAPPITPPATGSAGLR